MNVLLTGATGLLGRTLLDCLLPRGDRVQVLVRPATAGDTRKMGRLRRYAGVRVSFASMEDRAALERATDGVDVVHHAAWATGQEGEREDVRRELVSGTENLVRAAVRAGVPRFVFASSVAVYGPRPIVAGPAAEDGPLLARGNYGRGKIDAERAVRQLTHRTGTRYVILRPSLILSADAEYFQRFIRRALLRAPLGPAGRRMFQPVALDDTVDAFIAAGTRPSAADATATVAGAEAISLSGLALLIRAAATPRFSGLLSPGCHFDDSRFPPRYDLTRAKAALGFVPKTSLSAIAAEAVATLGNTFRNVQPAG